MGSHEAEYQNLRHLIFTDSDVRLRVRRIRAGAGRARLRTIRLDAGRQSDQAREKVQEGPAPCPGEARPQAAGAPQQESSRARSRSHVVARATIQRTATLRFLENLAFAKLRLSAPVAQWIEQRPSKPSVAGSIPAGGSHRDSVFPPSDSCVCIDSQTLTGRRRSR